MRQSRRLGAVRGSRTALQAPLVGSTWPMRIARQLLERSSPMPARTRPTNAAAWSGHQRRREPRLPCAQRLGQPTPVRGPSAGPDPDHHRDRGPGEEIAAIYHSHTKSEAYPSQTDVNLAANWPDPVYLICSLADPERPKTRAFAIRDGAVEEVELVVASRSAHSPARVAPAGTRCRSDSAPTTACRSSMSVRVSRSRSPMRTAGPARSSPSTPEASW